MTTDDAMKKESTHNYNMRTDGEYRKAFNAKIRERKKNKDTRYIEDKFINDAF